MAALAVRQKQIDANGFSTMRSASPRAHARGTTDDRQRQ